MTHARRLLLFVAPALVLILFACGSRSDLVPPGTTLSDSTEPGGSAHGAIDDASSPPPLRSPSPSQSDGSSVATPSGQSDAASLPALCDDASVPMIYAVTTTGKLLEFDPASSSFTFLAQANCDNPAYQGAYSMAVDHTGLAYVEYWEESTNIGAFYRVDLTTGACTPAPFTEGEYGFVAFGSGFSVDPGGESETLYILDSVSGFLGVVDPSTLAVSGVGTTSPVVENGELAGTGDGRLFTLYPGGASGSAAMIGQIDRTSVAVSPVAELPMDIGTNSAFALFGGDFYVFAGSPATVMRFRPKDGTTIQVASYSEAIVGAAASLCAPAN